MVFLCLTEHLARTWCAEMFTSTQSRMSHLLAMNITLHRWRLSLASETHPGGLIKRWCTRMFTFDAWHVYVLWLFSPGEWKFKIEMSSQWIEKSEWVCSTPPRICCPTNLATMFAVLESLEENCLSAWPLCSTYNHPNSIDFFADTSTFFAA